MPVANLIFFSFPSDYKTAEKNLILGAFQMDNIKTIEKKGFGEVMDLAAAPPETVVVTMGSGVLAAGLFEKMDREDEDAGKTKLLEGFSKKPRARVLFQIQLGGNELKVEININNIQQLDYVLKNLNELIQQHLNDGVDSYWITDGRSWQEIQPSQGVNEFFPTSDIERQIKHLRVVAVDQNPYTTAIIDINNKEEYEKMLELRKKVYINELHWITEENLFYDNEHAVFIIVYDENKNQVGSMRILKPESQWMIEEEFKTLLGDYKIKKEGAIEITRLLISKENRDMRESLWASVRLFRALYQWMTANHFSAIYMVVLPEYFKFFQLEGLRPIKIGTVDPNFYAVAGKIELERTMKYLEENIYDLWYWLTKKDDPQN
ncbi:MAG: hypothetical protein K6U80_20045 [Firmicutes bacterium]|nr:hypothetical protein [Bacillota bacterium]